MTPDGVETPVGPVLGRPQRSRDRARITAVAVVAVVVLGVGIGLAGNGPGNVASLPTAATPIPGASETAHAGGAPPANEPPSVSVPSPGPVGPPTPTPNVVFGCAPVRIGHPPELWLGTTRGGSPARGVAIPTTLPDQGSSPAAGWPTAPLGSAIPMLASSSLLLSSDEMGCIRYVVAEYLPNAPGPANSVPLELRTLSVSPPQAWAILGSLPVGDWIVRVVAYFWTGTAGQENGAVNERFFRIVIPGTAGPS